MATQGDLLLQLRDRLDESSAALWGDAELRRYINEGVRDLTRRAETNQTRATIATVAGTQEYSMPTDIVRVHRVEHQDASSTVTPLEYRDFNSMDSIWWNRQKTTESNRPYWYTLWGYPPSLKIVLYPTPSVTAETIRVFYYSVPADLATDGTDNADTIPVPQGWEDAVVQYAEYVAMRKDRNQQWQESKALYEQKVGELIERTRRWTDQAGVYDWDTGGGYPSWLVNPDGW